MVRLFELSVQKVETAHRSRSTAPRPAHGRRPPANPASSGTRGGVALRAQALRVQGEVSHSALYSQHKPAIRGQRQQPICPSQRSGREHAALPSHAGPNSPRPVSQPGRPPVCERTDRGSKCATFWGPRKRVRLSVWTAGAAPNRPGTRESKLTVCCPCRYSSASVAP